MSEVKNIYQRINEVMRGVRYIKKDTKVKGVGGGEYGAISHDGVIATIREELVNHGIVCVSSLKESKFDSIVYGKNDTKSHLYTGTYIVSYINIDKPEDRFCVEVEGQALGNDDKGPGKAISYATKTAHLKTFSMETGQNDESRVGLVYDMDSEKRQILMEAMTKAADDGNLKAQYTKLPRSDKDILGESGLAELKEYSERVNNGTA